MSKRHQSSRRKAYARRQHELRERAVHAEVAFLDLDLDLDPFDLGVDGFEQPWSHAAFAIRHRALRSPGVVPPVRLPAAD